MHGEWFCFLDDDDTYDFDFLSAMLNASHEQQARSGLLDMAIERGYQPDELALLSNAYFIAQALVTGGYRSCARPFSNYPPAYMDAHFLPSFQSMILSM